MPGRDSLSRGAGPGRVLDQLRKDPVAEQHMENAELSTRGFESVSSYREKEEIEGSSNYKGRSGLERAAISLGAFAGGILICQGELLATVGGISALITTIMLLLED
jgi:hypothetical protein